jgi:hypothetical protein
MQNSLTDNELRHMGKNTLDPRNNSTLNPQDYNPYGQQASMIGGFGQAMGHMGAMQGVSKAFRSHADGNNLEIGRMMRAEREQQMAEHEKSQQRFENFNKMLKGTVYGGAGGSQFN